MYFHYCQFRYQLYFVLSFLVLSYWMLQLIIEYKLVCSRKLELDSSPRSCCSIVVEHCASLPIKKYYGHSQLVVPLSVVRGYPLLLLFGVRCARPLEWQHSISPNTPTPHNQPIEGRRQNSRRQKTTSMSWQQESISSALETHQSHTIKHRVSKIVPKRHREGHKASALLRSPTTRRRERVPMSNQSTTSNTCRHIRQRQCTA